MKIASSFKGWILLISLFAGTTGQASERPNILFIFSDDHSLQALSAYEGRMQKFIREQGVTPNLERLAAQGAVFENSFVTNSICGPSRAAILTGKHSQHNGFIRNSQQFNPDQWTFPQALQEAGYNTAIFGKWHLGTAPRGFDESWVLQGQGYYYNPDFFVNGSSKLTRQEGYVSDVITEKTLEWLEANKDSDQPFFLCSWHKAPHRTWMPAERHLYFLENVDIPEPPTLFDDYSGRSSVLKEQTMSIANELNIAHDTKVTAPATSENLDAFWSGVENTKSKDPSTRWEFARMSDRQKQAWDYHYVARNEKFLEQNLKGQALTKWKYQAYMKDYLRCIKAMDENIGRLMRYLEESGLAGNTIVVYSSDQGFYNGEHGWYDKRWMYEESFRNPFLIRWPGKIKPGSRFDELIQNIDYAPTLLDIAGLNAPAEIQGESFKPILLGKDIPWRDSLLYTYYEQGIHDVALHYGVRDHRYKLIHFPETGEKEFYDLKQDPQEINNRWGDSGLTEEINRMEKELSRLMTRYGIESPLEYVRKLDQMD
ncbi:sulfatase [Puniceicoccales bacterium CK1056]|uniref:Sulfatase n=1 Tax=Oceanipulchritudo coccoides TaxID=2706888 RepID=A0A6B2LZL6_9BACT|nr:sulfatase [Oceanipulchritudo coccoides]NDV61592.1 sulfatase [Oceanipulchritudo coccoides]